MDFKQTFDYFAGKKILYVHGFGSSGATHTAALLQQKMPEAQVLHPDIPLVPAEQLPFLKALCEAERPDLIIGTSMGGMLVEKLRGFDRICVNPAMHMGQTMGTTIKFGEYPIATPREDGVTKINVTKALAKEFDEVCALNFEGLDSEDATRVVGLFGTRDPFVNCFAEFSEHYPSSAYFEGEHRLTDDVLLHSVMPIVRRFWERQAALDSPAVFIDYATLRDDYGKQRSSARLAFETLSQRYNVYCVAPQDAQSQQWLQENIGVPAWNHLFLTNHRERLYGDYLITLNARDEDTFLGTTLLFGSPQFKTWDTLLEYFDQMGGQ